MEVGGPQVGEVTCGGSPHLSCKRDQIELRDFMDRRVTPPTWSPPPAWKQALKGSFSNDDGDVNKNIKKTIGLMSKTIICMCITLFCTFLCRHFTTTT